MASKKFSDFAESLTWDANWRIVGYDPDEADKTLSNKRVPYSAFTDTFALKATFDAHAADQTLHLSAAQNAGLDASESPSAVNPYLTASAGDGRYLQGETDPVFTASPASNVKNDGVATEYLNGAGLYSTPAGGGGGDYTSGPAFPGTPTEGMAHYHTTRDVLYVYTGTRWSPVTSFSALTLYMDPAGDGDPFNAAGGMTTPAAMWDEIPSTFRGDITVNVKAGTYAGDLLMKGKSAGGPYSITFLGVGDTSVFSGAISVAQSDLVFDFLKLTSTLTLYAGTDMIARNFTLDTTSVNGVECQNGPLSLLVEDSDITALRQPFFARVGTSLKAVDSNVNCVGESANQIGVRAYGPCGITLQGVQFSRSGSLSSGSVAVSISAGSNSFWTAGAKSVISSAFLTGVKLAGYSVSSFTNSTYLTNNAGTPTDVTSNENGLP